MRAPILVILSAICFGTTGTAQALGPDGASSSSVGLTRIVAGGLLLAGTAWWLTRGAPGGRVVPRWDVVLIGGLAVLAYQPAFFAGARLNGVAIGTVVALGSAPVLTGVLEWLTTRRTPDRTWCVATTCAVVGVAALSGSATDGGSISVVGLGGSLGAGLAYAVYTLAAKRALDDGALPTIAIGSIFGAAAVMAIPLLLLVDISWVPTPAGTVMIGWLAVVTIVLAYILFATGLRDLPAATVSTLTLVEPLTACLLGIVVLDEGLSPLGWFGIAVLGIGVVVLARRRRVDAVVPA